MPDRIIDRAVDALGNAMPNALVAFHLRTSSIDADASGFDTAGLTTVLATTAAVMTDATGAFSASPTPNAYFDDDTPGSYYEVTFSPTVAGGRTFGPILIVVPAAGDSYHLQDLLTDVPAPLTTDPFQRMVPRLFTGDVGGYTEVNYGSPEVARDCKFRANSQNCEAKYMFRFGPGANMGTAGKYFAVELPVPADLSLGDGIAEAIGSFRMGHTGGFLHKGGSVHTGRVFDDLNPNMCYLVPDDDVALANNSFGITTWNNLHLYGIEYDR